MKEIVEQKEGVICHPIIWAARFRHEAIVREFLQMDPGLVREKSDYGENLLHLASDFELVREIIELDPTLLHEKSQYGEYPIHNFIFLDWGNNSYLQWILEQDLDQLYLKNASDLLPIHYFLSKKENLQMLEWMLREDPQLIRAKGEIERTTLHLACSYGCHSTIRFIIAFDDSLIFERDKEGLLPIHYLYYHEEMTDLLLWFFEKYPQLICEKGYDNSYPVHNAARDGNDKLLEYLLERTPDELLGSYRG